MDLVSVIIPVYQVSDYVERCLQSVLSQTYSDIECVIVDDATQDDSIAKCERLIKEYNGPIKFRILHHESNKGLSAARNTGTSAATGTYLYYLDSDDYISPDCIEKLIEPFMVDNALEMVQGNCLKICDEEEIIVYKGASLHITNNDDVRRHYLSPHHNIYISVWNKLLKRSFVEKNNLYCKEGIICEDHLWMFYLIKYLRNVYLCDAITYYYPLRSGSIVTSSDKRTKGNSFSVIFNEILENLSEGKEREELYAYVHLFCKRYLTFVNDSPALKESADLYKKNARKYGSWYVFLVLILIISTRQKVAALKVLEWLNRFRWKAYSIFCCQRGRCLRLQG